MDKNEFALNLKQFIDDNKDRKFHNSNVNPDAYVKILEKYINKKGTNVRAITSVPKLCQYYLVACMLNDYWGLQHDIENFIEDTLGYTYREDFKTMFDEVEIEMPDYRIIKDPKILYEDNKFYIYDKGIRHDAELYGDMVTYALCPKVHLSPDCWRDFQRTWVGPLGSVSVSVPWIIKGAVIFDKNACKYKVKEVEFCADYNLSGKSIVARYTGMGRSAWIAVSEFRSWDAFGEISYKLSPHKNWVQEHDDVIRGNVYIFSGEHAVAKIKGDFDGYYNNLSFDKLKDLLEQLC